MLRFTHTAFSSRNSLPAISQICKKANKSRLHTYWNPREILDSRLLRYTGILTSRWVPEPGGRRLVIMDWFRRIITLPASETQTGIVLAVCIFAMSIMSIVLVWQAQVIARQNAVIRMFESRLGS